MTELIVIFWCFSFLISVIEEGKHLISDQCIVPLSCHSFKACSYGLRTNKTQLNMKAETIHWLILVWSSFFNVSFDLYMSKNADLSTWKNILQVVGKCHLNRRTKIDSISFCYYRYRTQTITSLFCSLMQWRLLNLILL